MRYSLEEKLEAFIKYIESQIILYDLDLTVEEVLFILKNRNKVKSS